MIWLVLVVNSRLAGTVRVIQMALLVSMKTTH
jgi:hypothetical protein